MTTTTTAGRRKYQVHNAVNGTITAQTSPAQRSQTMSKVSKLMNGNMIRPLPPMTKQRPNFDTTSTRQHNAPFNSSTHHHLALDQQSGHKTQTLNTRRGGNLSSNKSSSTLFRNSSVCNLERDSGLGRGMQCTKSGTVLLDNSRRKGTSTTNLWDDDRTHDNRINRSTSKVGNSKMNVSNGRRMMMHHQSLHQLPSASSSTCSSSESSPRNLMKHSSSSSHHLLCHQRLPPPDYSDSGMCTNAPFSFLFFISLSQ